MVVVVVVVVCSCSCVVIDVVVVVIVIVVVVVVFIVVVIVVIIIIIVIMCAMLQTFAACASTSITLLKTSRESRRKPNKGNYSTIFISAYIFTRAPQGCRDSLAPMLRVGQCSTSTCSIQYPI